MAKKLDRRELTRVAIASNQDTCTRVTVYITLLGVSTEQTYPRLSCDKRQKEKQQHSPHNH